MGYFVNRAHKPSPEAVQTALGSRYPLWERLIRFIESDEQVEGGWSFWGPAKSGWNLRFKRKGKALTALYPGKESLVVQVVLGKNQAEWALTLNFGEKVSEILREAPQLHDGRWLHIQVLEGSDAEDVEKLIRLKMQTL
jgi:hypothetical protein